MRRHFQTSLSVLLAVSLILWGAYSTVVAGTGTITVKDASGSTQTYAVVTDGSGHYIAEQVICDYSAGANCASVTSSHELTVFATALGTISDAAWSSGNGTVIALLKNIATGIASAVSDLASIVTNTATIATNSAAPIPDCGATPCTNKIGTIYQQSPYPAAATPITGNATGTTGAVVGTLAGTSGKTTYICGFDVSAIGGTAAVGPITVAGLVGSSMVYELASTATGVTLPREFNPCIPASATNTNITITTTPDGTASAVAVNSHGFQQ